MWDPCIWFLWEYESSVLALGLVCQALNLKPEARGPNPRDMESGAQASDGESGSQVSTEFARR